jgi:hypothetical protein
MGATKTTGDSAATMRVLICDQESEMLERIARAFEVDIATSKSTCIDLMRANAFDVLVASERLSDGSGLELLSHVATRWPDTLRVLAIEPQRLKLLRGKLGPFRLHATLKYPIDEDELEDTLADLQRTLFEPLEDEPEAPVLPPANKPQPAARPAQPAPTRASAPDTLKVQKVQISQPVVRSSATFTKTSPPSRAAAAPATTPPRSPPSARAASPPDPTPVRRRLGNYTPLGAPEDEQLRIVEREFDQTVAPLAARAIRTREEASRPRTSSEKAKHLAGQLSDRLKRLLKR